MAIKTTPTSPAAWRPDTTAYTATDAISDALILQTSTLVGSIEGDAPSVRVPFVQDDATVSIVAEAAEIPDAAQAFDETVVTTHKLSTLGKYSFETLAQPEAARLVVDSLSRSIANKANAVYLGNASAPTGLLNTSGITDAGTITTDLDELIDAVSGIEADGGMATHIVASPTAWSFVAKLKVEPTSAQPLLGAGTSATQRQLLGLPVLVSASMPAGDLLVLDKNAIVAAQSPLRLARSEDAYFSSDVIAIKLVWRIGWSVMHESRIGKLTT